MARNVPLLFHVYVVRVLDRIWVALRDTRVSSIAQVTAELLFADHSRPLWRDSGSGARGSSGSDGRVLADHLTAGTANGHTGLRDHL